MNTDNDNTLVNLPKLKMPRHISHVPSIQQDFINVSFWGIEINAINLRYYLDNQLALIEDVKHAKKTIDELNVGTSYLQKVNRYDKDLRSYHIHTGLLFPTNIAPWKRVENDDNYLTCYTLSNNGEAGAARHYISIEKHEAIMQEKLFNIEKLIATHVTRGVEKGVSKAVEQTTLTLNQIEDQKKHLAKEMAKLEKLEASIKAKASTRRSTGTPTVRAGYVYLLRTLHDETLFKIGRTSNPDNRAKTFGVTLPFPVEYVCLIQSDDMYILEGQLHAKFSQQRLDGEFFRLSPDDVEYIKGLAA